MLLNELNMLHVSLLLLVVLLSLPV